MRRVAAFAALLALSPLTRPAPSSTEGYYRFPTLHDTTIVFTAEGDLWKIGLSGGLAERLTTHAEEETHAAISPDGKTIAFSAAYEGPTEVYTMPIDGGLPVRQTYLGGTATVVGWTPQGKVLYTTTSYSTLPDAELATLDPTTHASDLIPLAQAHDGSYGPDGTLYFTRPAAQSSHTKRYKGGTAQHVWKYAPGAAEAVELTGDYDGTSRTPMYWKGRVYFASDRDGTMNIWSMDADGGALTEETHHVGWDVETPSLAGGRIVYQLGADLWVYDIASRTDRKLDIRLASDFDQMREKWVQKPMDYLTAAHIAPDGGRVVLTARGQVFVAPVGQGRFVEATRHQGVRYRQARFAPDGKSLLVLSDESGETEWWRLPANGVGAPTQLTDDAHVLRFDGVASPDGRYIAYYDKNWTLWLFDTEKKKTTKVAASLEGEFGDLAWSPDSHWLAYDETATSSFEQIKLYHVDDGAITAITSDRFDSYSPAWSRDGKWIYFLSDRVFQSLVSGPWGSREPEPFFDKQTKLYALPLVPGLRSPFQPKDELEAPDTASQRDGHAERGARAAPPATTIDLSGIADRIMELPVPSGNYRALDVNGKRLFYLSSETSAPHTTTLEMVALSSTDTTPKALVHDVRSYELSADGRHVLVRKHDRFYVIGADAAPGVSLEKAGLDLSGWKFPIDPREEWHQMFVEAWRLERDYFYDRGMNGIDWSAMRKKYEPLVDRVTERGELSDILGQMISELSALHMFVYGGDFREGNEQIAPASLGAELTRDSAAGGYRIAHIYENDPDLPDQLSPLGKPGLGIHDGDVITQINGVPTLSVQDPAELLRNQTGRQVLLAVRPAGDGGAREVIVEPISERAAANLRYSEWEYTRRRITDSLSHDSIGYVHLRAMSRSDIDQWERDFYPVFNRQGLIIDMRHNRGGNIDSWILEKLLRRAWFYWQPRIGNPYWNMQYAFRGHIVVLCDQHTASDGEAFTEGFKRLHLGKVIGMRTWGGEIWLSSSNVLVDHGIATAAEFGVYGPEGKWLIEGHGVDPDTVVDNLPHATFLGQDAQLDAAIAILKREIKTDPNPVPPHPAYPDKSFKEH